MLGKPELILDGQPLPVTARKSLALFVFLALNEGPVSRQRLAGLIWGETAEAEARASLRTALNRLPRALAILFAR